MADRGYEDYEDEYVLNVKNINRPFPVNQFLALTMIEVYREEFCLRPYVSI